LFRCALRVPHYPPSAGCQPMIEGAARVGNWHVANVRFMAALTIVMNGGSGVDSGDSIALLRTAGIG
jgi:hypothetical protein